MNPVRYGSLFVCAAMLAACATIPPTASDTSKPPFRLEQIAPGVYAAIAVPGSGAGANAGFVIGDDSVAVIDTFVSASAAEALMTEIRKVTPLPVRYVVNTHHHVDHVAGNAVFRRQGAVLIGQRNMRGWVHSENLRLFSAAITPERRAQVEALVEPELGYASELVLDLGRRPIIVRSHPGHTGADSVVLVPDASALFAGDLVWRRSVPNLIDATVADWIETLNKLADQAAPGMIVVPGHGDVGTAGDVAEFRGYLTALRDAVIRGLGSGLDGTALQTAVVADLGTQYGDWAYFTSLAPRNVSDMAAELNGRKRVPARAAAIDVRDSAPLR